MKKNYIDIKDLSDSRQVLEAKYPRIVTIFIVTLLVVLTTTLVWCYFGKLDTYAKASGEIRTEESISTLTSLTTGKITNISYNDGDNINKDEIILYLDTDYYNNQKEIINSQLKEKQDKINDYELLIKSIKNDKNYFNSNNSMYYDYENYAIEMKETIDSYDNSKDQVSNTKNEYDLSIKQYENSKSSTTSLLNEYKALYAAINNETLFSGSNQALIDTYNSYMLSYNQIKPTYDSSKANYDNLVARQALDPTSVTDDEIKTAKAQLDKATNDINTLKTNSLNSINKSISELNSEISSYNASIDSYKLKKEALSYTDNLDGSKQKIKNSYYISINNNIESINNEILTLNSKLDDLNKTLESLSIKSTSNGILVYSKDYALGDTIQAGEIVASIIPESSSYKVIIYLPENKVSEVSVGQDVEYVVDSLSITDYGKPKGKIESISADSFSEQTSGSKYYKVVASIENTSLINKKDGQERNLKVGMIVESHIITGSQTIMTYLLDKLNFE